MIVNLIGGEDIDQPGKSLDKVQASFVYKRLPTPNDANILSRAIMRIFGMRYDWKGVRTRRIRRFKLGLSSLIAFAVVALPFVWPVVN